MTSMPLLRITSRWDCLATHQYGRSYCMCQTDKPQPSWIGSHNAISNKEQKMSTIPNTVAIPADHPPNKLVVARADKIVNEQRSERVEISVHSVSLKHRIS